VFLLRHRVRVGQGIWAGDVQMVLKTDEVGWLVGFEQSVEGDIGRDAGGTLCAGEQLHQDDSVDVFVLSSGLRSRWKGGYVLVVFGIQLLRELGKTSFAFLGQLIPACCARRLGNEFNHGLFCLECFFVQAGTNGVSSFFRAEK
jgi:hypothetical protein